VHDVRGNVELGEQLGSPDVADDQHQVGFEHGLALTLDQRRGGEVVDVVDRSDHAWADPRVTDSDGCPRRDAVLRVDQREPVAERSQTLLERVD